MNNTTSDDSVGENIIYREEDWTTLFLHNVSFEIIKYDVNGDLFTIFDADLRSEQFHQSMSRAYGLIVDSCTVIEIICGYSNVMRKTGAATTSNSSIADCIHK